MIADKELQSLAQFSGTAPVLSLYLDTDLADKPKDAVKLAFRQLIKNLPIAPASSVVARISDYLEYQYDWLSPGLAIFVASDTLWKTVPLPIVVKGQAFLGDRPYVRPLVDVSDRFGRYGVALLDRESVRLFSVVGGKIEARSESFGEELKHHRQGGWAAARYQRHTDNLALHNLKQAIELTAAFCQQAGCDRLVLGGRNEVLKQVQELLPSELRTAFIGEFVADMDTPPDQLLQLSQAVATKADSHAEQQLVKATVTAASRGGAGAIGLADTLYALQAGRVRQLLVAEHYQASGYVCANCGYVAADRRTCPTCGHAEMQPVADVVNRALVEAIRAGADVNIVRQVEALDTAGGIAALLRY